MDNEEFLINDTFNTNDYFQKLDIDLHNLIICFLKKNQFLISTQCVLITMITLTTWYINTMHLEIWYMKKFEEMTKKVYVIISAKN